VADAPLVAVTHHAAERFRQRVGTREGALDVRPEIVRRVARAVAAGRAEEGDRGGHRGPKGRGLVRVRDLVDRDLVFVCRRGRGELVVVSLWEEGRVGTPRVPRWVTDRLG
jgi:hypothetical protein